MVLSPLNYRLLANFFDFVMELKAIKRSGWINKVKVKNPESVADHTYVMSTMVMVFSDILGMKTEEYRDIWKEYLENKTDTSQLVHSVDRFEMAFQAKKYESQGYPSSVLQQFLNYATDGEDSNDVLLLLKRTKDASFSE